MLPESSATAADARVPPLAATAHMHNSEPALQDAGPTAESFVQLDSIGIDAVRGPAHGQGAGQLAFGAPILSCPNEYESLVYPDEFSVVDDPLLLRTPYIVNISYMVLICIQCRHAVALDNASAHARRLHKSCKMPDSFVTELDKKYPGLTSLKIHPGSVIPPVFGLEVPLQQFEVCARCLRGYSNLSSWRNHNCDAPQVNLNGKPLHFSSLVQTFFRGPKLCYFPVKTPVSALEKKDIDEFALLHSQFSPVDILEDEIIEPSDYREMDQFLCKEGWISHVAGNSRSELSTLTRLPQQGELLAPIRQEIYLLMSRIQAAIGGAGFYVRRLLRKRPS